MSSGCLYFLFLLLEDVIVGYYCTETAFQDISQKTFDTFQKNMALNKDYRLISNDEKQKYRYILNISTTTVLPNKMWKLERVTRKQYEIFNMVWRKTKIFLNEENIYTINPNEINNPTNIHKTFKISNNKHNLLHFSAHSSALHTTTPSKIEFYYFDDSLAKANEQLCVEPNCKLAIPKTSNSNVTTNLPFLIFHLKSRSVSPQSATVNLSRSIMSEFNTEPQGFRFQSYQRMKYTKQVKAKQNVLNNKTERKILSLDKYFKRDATLGKTCKLSRKDLTHNTVNVDQVISESTTVYDKIKFFELYDHNTQKSNIKSKALEFKKGVENITIQNRKILLEDINQGSHDHNVSNPRKKHINFESINIPCCQKHDKKTPESKNYKTHHPLKRKTNETAYFFKGNLSRSEPNRSDSVFSYENKQALWSEYPFLAVYIYKPLQVHCDAAAIKPHWLVASGSCLSRVRKKPYGGDRSAFVAYCGEQWWLPERVAYVKYSVVHPLFHHRDKIRKYHYNIGIIQVVSSMMSACTGWAPVSLMSHQFAAESEGSCASAVGWGLDRFDRNYGATDLPRTPPMVYESALYFNSCPGSIGYSKAKRLAEGGGVKNVLCLALPPYASEDNDPVHGGLLLFGGKLTALYLQEERRLLGEQSAQYTGVWRLIPWIMEMAKEPDEMDTFTFEI